MFTRSFSVGRTRVPGRSVSLVLALGLVAVALLLAGCPMEDDDTASIEGTWEFTSDFGTDAYIITADTVKYGSGSGADFVSKFEAKIHEVQYFTDAKDAGMLYIEYTTKKPQYTSGSYGPAPDYEYTQTGGPFDPPGNFVVVMFHELKSNTVKLANPYNANDTIPAKGNGGIDVTFIASEVPTLAAAKTKFNVDTESNYLYAGWSGVTAQTRK
jgi:hypothetical protein